MENKNIISLENVSHGFRSPDAKISQKVLDDISFFVEKGQFLSIIGPSGCGKSTLLRIIAGLLKPAKGEIICNTKKHSMIFQNFAIFPWLNVFENVEFGLKMKNAEKKQGAAIANEKIEEVGLIDFKNKFPHELSGGMKQRVGIARALAVEPELLLADEPFSNLDYFTAESLRLDILKLWKKYNMTVVLVTHLVEEALELSDKIIVLGKSPARVLRKIDVSLPRPRNKRSEEFFALVDEITELIKI